MWYNLSMAADPTTIVIFGITGDLAQKKILPALADLHARGALPTGMRVVGFSRRDMSQTDIRAFVAAALGASGITASVDAFLDTITYVQGEFGDAAAYRRLGEHLQFLDAQYHMRCSNKLFYLSVPPTLYEMIATELSASGLSIPCGGPDGYARILVEKPFGKDLLTAEALDLLFGNLFKEEQVFRIDHYLAKNTLQEILRLRQADPSHDGRWNATYIDRVEIDLFETAVVGSRGPFYDGVGALRDVGQNHVLQMLALVAMDADASVAPADVQKRRADVLERLVPLSPEALQHSRRGQYDGYRSEPGVVQDSMTETFFSLVAYVDTARFRGVPFVLSAGKALSRNETKVTVRFKDGSIQTFVVPQQDSLPAYQKILLDCIAGDQTVFTSTAEVLAEWKFISPIVHAWQGSAPIVYQKSAEPESLVLTEVLPN